MEEKKTRKVKALVAVDDSEPSERAVILSGRFAKDTGINLTLLHVIDNPKGYKEIPEDWRHKPSVKEAEEMLNRFKRLAEANGAKDVQTMLAIGSISGEIVRIAEENDFDYLVLGTRGMGALKRFFLGSVADKVVHQAHLPVVVTRIIEKEKRIPFKREEGEMRLLVAVDDSRASEKAVLGTSQFAGNANLHITLIHVLEDVIHYDEIPDTYVYNLRKEEAKRILDKSKAIAEALGIRDVDTKIVVGPIEEEINRAATGYASIVLGWKDGSIFGKLLSSAPRPIVIIR
ncbi:MAG: hypothetical protein DRG39_01580 [Deltaproteobacteria bacterium]|nr:MAG: hypothetical protein DRG39_01580 [Deltaproteobacteria bacterium]